MASVTRLLDPTFYNVLSYSLAISPRRRKPRNFRTCCGVSLHYFYSVHDDCKVRAGRPPWPLRRSTHFKHNPRLSCAYLKISLQLFRQWSCLLAKQRIDDATTQETLFTLIAGGEITTKDVRTTRRCLVDSTSRDRKVFTCRGDRGYFYRGMRLRTKASRTTNFVRVLIHVQH